MMERRAAGRRAVTVHVRSVKCYTQVQVRRSNPLRSARTTSLPFCRRSACGCACSKADAPLPAVHLRARMAVAFVPDWDPTKKQKAREPSPWGDDPGQTVPTSSYSQHYQKWPSTRMPNFKPQRVFDPKDRMVFNTRSTQQDSFQAPIGHKQIASFKPEPKYQSVDWQQPITTTAQSTYIRYENVKRTVACRPKQQERDTTSRFTAHSTSQDSYQPIPSGYKPVPPFYPSSDSQVAPAQHHPSNFQTTFQVRAT